MAELVYGGEPSNGDGGSRAAVRFLLTTSAVTRRALARCDFAMDLASDHSPFLSQPVQLCDVILG
jgi:hypothetical protein